MSKTNPKDLASSTMNDVLQQAGVAMEVLENVSEYIARLAAEVEKYKKNSERYEWLRQGDNDDLVIVFGKYTSWLPRLKDLDKAIDIKMKKEQ